MGPDGSLITALLPALAAVVLLALLAFVLVRERARIEEAAAREQARTGEAERRLTGVLASARDGVLVHTTAGRVLQMNEAAARLLDVDVAAVVGRDVADLPVRWLTEGIDPVTPRAVFARRSGAAPAMALPGAAPAEPVVTIGPDGIPTAAPAPPSAAPALPGLETGPGPAPLLLAIAPLSGAPLRWVHVSTRPVPTPDGGHELLTTLADMTGPREIGAALVRSETQFRMAMDNAPIGMVLADPQWRLLEVNRAFAALLGLTPATLLGKDLSALSHPHERAGERAQVQRLLAGETDRFTLEKRYQRGDGHTVWAVLDVVLVRTPDGRPDHFVAQVRDVTESRMQSEALAHRALHDPLTGLGNRALMQEVLQGALDQPGAAGRVAVVVVDLDEFKQINDRYGHAAGDDVIVHVAGVLRSATSGRGTAVRLGGDEFVVVVQDPDAARVVFEVAAGIHQGLRNPVRTGKRMLPVRASVGVAVVEHGLLAGGPMAVLAAADAALYRAKAAGRGRTEVYESSMSTQSSKHGAAAELEAAIAAGQLVLHYQPVVDLTSGAVVGHEALVRWQHPERGLLLPGAFLPTAEETGLGTALGATVVALAAGHLGRTVGRGGWVSVNLSAEQLAEGDLAQRVLAELAAHGAEPGRFVVELSEASLAGAGAGVRDELVRLRAAGVPVLLDDFGTGASPLSYLRELPVSGVKLDMSYAAGIPEDPQAARVSRALGALAREMQMTTIAAGIETAEQAEHLRRAGWHLGQGWLFGAGQSEPVRGLVDHLV